MREREGERGNIEPLSEMMGRERGGNGKGEEEKEEILSLFLR